jgi:hypothetical protein
MVRARSHMMNHPRAEMFFDGQVVDNRQANDNAAWRRPER